MLSYKIMEKVRKGDYHQQDALIIHILMKPNFMHELESEAFIKIITFSLI